MMSAQARIEGYQIGYPEFLNVSYEHPSLDYSVSVYVNIMIDESLYGPLLNDIVTRHC